MGESEWKLEGGKEGTPQFTALEIARCTQLCGALACSSLNHIYENSNKTNPPNPKHQVPLAVAESGGILTRHVLNDLVRGINH